jgi:hypothetical protein
MTSPGGRVPDRLTSAAVTVSRRVMAAASAGTVMLLTACGSASGAGRPASAAHRSTPAVPAMTSSPSPSPSASPTAFVPLPVAPGAGALRQTMVRPKASGPVFQAMITDLWQAVTTGRPALARPSFFPVDAYKQVKAIWNPSYDWRSRLWLDFAVDIRAAHRLLGSGAGTARLLRVIVPAAEDVWVGPGACYNKVGYWHVAGPRVVYREDGQVRSFGIASLISWRGVWYVVHFGGVTRPAVGMVDAPAIGPGYPGPPGGC